MTPSPVSAEFNANQINAESQTVLKSPFIPLHITAIIKKIGIANIRYLGQLGFLGCSLSSDNFDVDSIVDFFRFSWIPEI